MSLRANAGVALGAAITLACLAAHPGGNAVVTAALAADNYPSRPIRVISPFPPGSASDTVSRVVLDKVSQELGQPMVIETKPGAGGTVGFADVAKADPDGYTVVASSTSMGTEKVLHTHLSFDPDKDFQTKRLQNRR
jgi:tripartite-type tricarboxylate transporter receptor subunit TctC